MMMVDPETEHDILTAPSLAEVAERLCACGCGISLIGRSRLARHASDRCRSKMAHAARRALHPPKERKPKMMRTRLTEAAWRKTLIDPRLPGDDLPGSGYTFDPALQGFDAPATTKWPPRR